MMDKFANGIPSVVHVLIPQGTGWVELAADQRYSLGYPLRAFMHTASGLRVLSAVETITDLIGTRPEYHISISKSDGRKPVRCDSNEAKWVLSQFRMDGYFEDNHVHYGNEGGIVRNFWRPVADALVGQSCPCEETEPVIREDNGDFCWRPAPEK